MKRLNIIVSGKVQGVWYRKNTQEKALELSLKGFVKNQKDGSVFIDVVGEEAPLIELILWCNNGPENAVVTGLQIVQKELVDYNNFTIDRS